MSFFMLLIFRNQSVNLFQHVLGVFLFACNTPKAVFHALGRLGISSAHSTVHNILERLGDSAYEALAQMGKSAYESASDAARKPQEYFLLLFDNINKYHRARKQTVAKKSEVKSGTAATAVVLEDVPSGAFDPQPYFDNLKKQDRRNLTLTKLYEDIDTAHLRNAGIGMIMRLLVVHIPDIKPLSSQVEVWFTTNCERLKLRLRKSRIQPMGTSGIDESTAAGGSDVLNDLAEQMKLQAGWLKKMLVMVCGDWLSIDRLRKAIRYKAKDSNIYEQRRWALPIVQLWHMKWAFLKVIYKIHWSDETGPDVSVNLRHGLEANGRNFNHIKCDFYPGHEGLKTVFDTLVLTGALTVLQDNSSGALDTATDNRSTHMLSDLRSQFESGGKLENCTLSELEKTAGLVYDRFFTTGAYLEATSMKDLNLSEPQMTNTMSSLMAKLGIHRRQPDTTQPESGAPREQDTELETQLESAGAMDVGDDYPGSGDSGSDASSLMEPLLDVQPSTGVPIANLGDVALGNAILLIRDGFWYLEFATAVTEGDIGRIFEIIKVSYIAYRSLGTSKVRIISYRSSVSHSGVVVRRIMATSC
jgi:hypothetical protein